MELGEHLFKYSGNLTETDIGTRNGCCVIPWYMIYEHNEDDLPIQTVGSDNTQHNTTQDISIYKSN